MADGKQRTLGVQRAAADVLPPSDPKENTQYKVGDDIGVLLDEVLNNKTRAILVFDDFSGKFTDFDLYQLSVVIRHNTSLVAITISGVDIGDETVALLCQSLIPTNVQYIDFTNTPLDEEAGSSLAALARCNTNLRTVVVTDTLISEDLMDEIDVACMDNEIANDAPRVVTVDPDRTLYCYAHVLQCCPNGEYCLFSHSQPGNSSSRPKSLLDWDKALPPPPKEGASWKPQYDDDGEEGSPKMRLDLKQFRDARKRVATSAPVSSSPAAQSLPQTRNNSVGRVGDNRRRKRRLVLGVVATAAAVALVAVAVAASRNPRCPPKR
jgi:hypothetical protein